MQATQEPNATDSTCSADAEQPSPANSATDKTISADNAGPTTANLPDCCSAADELAIANSGDTKGTEFSVWLY